MRTACHRWLASIVAALLPAWTFAHHSVAEFDVDHPVTLNATVKEVWFSNPHVRYYVVVKGENGVEENWDVHGSSVTSLVRKGWTKESIKVGDEIQINGSPNRKGLKRILIRNIVLKDGTMLGSPAEPGERRSE